MNEIPNTVTDSLRGLGWGEVTRAEALSGGDISVVRRLTLTSGRSVVLKTNADAPPNFFACEAEGLAALRVPGGPRVPEMLVSVSTFLLMEDLRPASSAADFWPVLGKQLAALHRTPHDRFGFAHDNFIGATPQPNPWTVNGHEFFAEHRLRFQARRAFDAGRLTLADAARVERLCAMLPERVPPQPPALLHGDLWRGNVICDAQGQPALIDPAAHWGWAEAEMGLTALFGGFPASFYDAYTDVSPLTPGWRERLPIYNLYHLLNHLNLFGGGYRAQVRATLAGLGA